MWLVACGVMRIVTRSSSSKTDVGVSAEGSQRCKRSILQRVLGARNRDLIAVSDGVRQRDSLVRMAREQKVVENATIKHSMHVRDVETRSTRPQIVTLIKRAENVGRSVIWQVRATSWIATTQAKGSRQTEQGWQRYEFSQNVRELW